MFKTEKSHSHASDVLACVPVVRVPWAMDDQGHVFLIKEKTTHNWLKKVIAWVGKSQHFHIHLDKIGTTVWQAIDGQRTVGDIAHLVRETFGEDFKQPEQRVSYFLTLMHRDKFVELMIKQ